LLQDEAKNLMQMSDYEILTDNLDFVKMFKLFQNSLVKNNERRTNMEFIEKFVYFVEKRYQKEIDEKKSVLGKETWNLKLKEMLDIIENNLAIWSLIECIEQTTVIKHSIIRELEKNSIFETFIVKNDTRIPTGNEGYALSDSEGNVVKLVNRYEFSSANFSPDVTKGWSK